MREDMKTVIADTFIHMIEKEDLDKITVKHLIGECRISRQTFYYHFHDIMDVLEWAFRKSAEELAEKSLNAESRMDAVGFFVAFIKEHRDKLERMIYSRRWVQIEAMLVESVMMYLETMVRMKAPDWAVSYEERQILLRFLAGGMVGVLLEYAGKSHVNEEHLIMQLDRIINGMMAA